MSDERIPSWNDDMIDGARETVAFLERMLIERSQLYGMLIHIMLLSGKMEYNMPDGAWFREVGDKYYVVFHPTENGKWKAQLKERTFGDAKSSLD